MYTNTTDMTDVKPTRSCESDHHMQGNPLHRSLCDAPLLVLCIVAFNYMGGFYCCFQGYEKGFGHHPDADTVVILSSDISRTVRVPASSPR